jgi:hypothetical protein
MNKMIYYFNNKYYNNSTIYSTKKIWWEIKINFQCFNKGKITPLMLKSLINKNLTSIRKKTLNNSQRLWIIQQAFGMVKNL